MSKQILLAQERRDGKIHMPKKKDTWDIAEIALGWILTALAISVIVVFWHDGGLGLGMLATISGAIVIWKEGPWKKAK